MEDTGKEKKVLKFDKKKSILIGSVSISLLLVLVIVAICVSVNRGYRSIQVNRINGTTTVKRNGSSIKGYESMLLRTKDKISTETGSTVQLKLDDTKYALMEENTSVSIECSGSQTSNRMKLVVEKGAISNIISKALEDSSAYEVHTPNVTMSVRGTKFRVALDTFDNVQVVDTTVTTGKVLVTTFYYDKNGKYVVDEEYELDGGYGYLVIVTKIAEGVYTFEKHLYQLSLTYVISEDASYANILPIREGLMPADVQAKYDERHKAKEEPEPSGTPIVSNELTLTPAPSDTPVPTKEPTKAPDPTAVPSDTPVPTTVPTEPPVPTVEPTKAPNPTATPKPTPKPTKTPTATPKPTKVPTVTPKPTKVPTATPKPTKVPTPTPGKIMSTPIPTPTPRPLIVSISPSATLIGQKSTSASLKFEHNGAANKEIVIKSISFPTDYYKIDSVDGDATVKKDGDFYVVIFGSNTKLSTNGATFNTAVHGKIAKTNEVPDGSIKISLLYGGELYEYFLKRQ